MNTLVTRKNVYERKDSDKETQRKNKAIIPVDPMKGNPLLYNCVLEIIFKYMKINELCKFRTVNSVWNEEASNWIIKRKEIYIGFGIEKNGKPNGIHTWRFMDWKKIKGCELYLETNVAKHSEILKTFKLGRLNLIMRLLKFPPPTSNFKENADKLTELVCKLPHKLQYLNISCQLLTKQDEERFHKIFSAESVVFFKELKLVIYLDHRSAEFLENLKSLKPLQKVERLTLKILWENGVNDIDPEIYNLISRMMLFLLPNVKAIKIEPSVDTIFSLSNYYQNETFDTPLTDVICHQLKNQMQLKELSLPLREEYFKATEHITSKEFPNITRLEIRLNINDNSTDIRRLFERYAKTIQQLSVQFNLRPASERLILLEVDVPIFPKLTKLAIICKIGNQEVGFKKLDLSFRFLNDELDYKVQFPLLTELSLGSSPLCTVLNNQWEFYEQFLPSPNFDERMTEQIKILNVPILDKGDGRKTFSYERDQLPLYQLMDRLNKIFPNVHHKGLQQYVDKIPYFLNKLKTLNPTETEYLDNIRWHTVNWK